MIELAREDTSPNATRIGTQPIALAAVTLMVILASAAAMALWRAHTGTSPETDRAMAARQLQQAHAAQVSQQLVEKTRGLEVTQQESIDQLQVVQDQLQQVRKQLAAQQADAKRLSGQVAGLSEAVDSLRQSFASAQSASEPSSPPTPRRRASRRVHSVRTAAAKPRS
ncbi:hypothetical protein [Bradyrhizobium sp. STM 3562]|uniref:hypothetical protein n=1 Tax=Bradyrhizobium sp. STM 3562 TaxID=578924 RepID=UPI00388D8C26